MTKFYRASIFGAALLLVTMSFFAFSTCKGKSAAKIITSVLCGRGDQKTKMTAGFNLDIIKSFFPLTDGQTVSNQQVKDYLNNILEKNEVSPSTFSISNVESVKEGDSVRFLQLGGAIGDGFGVAIGFLKSIFSGSNLTTANPFTFMSESFGVSAAEAENLYRRQKVRQFFKVWAPFMLSEESINPHNDQWAYKQGDFAKTKELFASMLSKSGRDISAKPVVVAVLDTGADLGHPDLQDAFLRDAKNEIISFDATSGGSAQDENGHGTHCAGIIGGRMVNEDSALGIATMANVKIVPIKVLGAKGSGGFQEIEKGIRWAMHQGVDVLSMSLGAGMEYSDVSSNEQAITNKVIEEAIAAKILILVAAGNEACPLAGSCKNSSGLFQKKFDNYLVLPCAYDGSICVGATNADDTLAEYSNFSSKRTAAYRTKADINAPGTAIYSAWPTNLESSHKTISGTSMATPFAAGVAALIKTVVPGITQAEVKDILQRSQANTSALSEKSDAGRIDVYTALLIVAKEKLMMEGLPEVSVPPPSPVADAPKPNGGSGVEGLVGTLWGSVCS